MDLTQRNIDTPYEYEEAILMNVRKLLDAHCVTLNYIKDNGPQTLAQLEAASMCPCQIEIKDLPPNEDSLPDFSERICNIWTPSARVANRKKTKPKPPGKLIRIVWFQMNPYFDTNITQFTRIR